MAALLGKPKQTVSHYRKQFPEDVCPAVEQATGVPVEVLRRDLTWVRVPSAGWPNGKPLLDVTPPKSSKPREGATASNGFAYVKKVLHVGHRRSTDKPSNTKER